MTLRVDPELREMVALRELVDFTNREVIETGCGDGRLTFRYAPLARRVYAFDQFLESVETARRNTLPELRDRVEFYVGDAQALSLPNERFDLALMAWSL